MKILGWIGHFSKSKRFGPFRLRVTDRGIFPSIRIFGWTFKPGRHGDR